MSKAKRNPRPTADDLCEFVNEDGIRCDMPYASLNEIFFGNDKRQVSIKYGMQIRLCEQRGHHQFFHSNKEYQRELQERYQRKFENLMMEYGLSQDEARGVFLREFGRNYLD